ncbi:TonB family protein [Pontixanthobacter sp. CEM42]|uniref:TonB family protein n=1 Tax=Pontixanthobacter sp. CEM42 TaxID=2792077 RepID=UPI001ADF73C3|nr:TonB family protein [Pontixanthobacter sp. CEM42]
MKICLFVALSVPLAWSGQAIAQPAETTQPVARPPLTDPVPLAPIIDNRPPRPDMVVEPIGSVRSWIGSRDYPASAASEKRSGKTEVRLTVGESGRVSNCAVTVSSGHGDLDEQACAVLAQRARFRPATDGQAVPIAANFDHTVVWKMRETLDVTMTPTTGAPAPAVARVEGRRVSSFPQSPRIGFNSWNHRRLNDYPPAALERGSEGRVKVILTIGADGGLAGCEVIEAHDDAALNKASCEAAAEITEIDPALDFDGKPTAGRIERYVSWTLPDKETVVVSRRASQRKVRLPFSGNGATGFEIETKADGTVISCRTISEGELPKALNFVGEMCANAKKNGVQKSTFGPVATEEPSDLGVKLKFEMRIETSRVDNADKPIEGGVD